MSDNHNVIIDEDKLKISILNCIKNKKLDFNLLFEKCSNSVKCITNHNYANYNPCNLEKFKITEQQLKDLLNKYGICITEFEIRIKDIITFLRYFYYCKDININIEDLIFTTSIPEYKITKLLYSTGYKVGSSCYSGDGVIKRQRRINE
jgi:hypothetical protein